MNFVNIMVSHRRSEILCFLFLLGRFLGSVEVSSFKGNEIICNAMKEVIVQN